MSYDIKDFAAEVVNRSFSIPVLVDFWAEWCGPCKVIGPILEKLAAKSSGRWVLAKVNTELLQNVAAEYNISSIPNVKLFVDGNIVGEFVGALPEYQIERWLEKTLPSKFQKDIEKAVILFAEGKVEDGKKILEGVIQTEPENIQARVLLASTIIFSEPEKAVTLVTEIIDPRFSELAEAIITLGKMFNLRSNSAGLSETLTKQKYLDAIEDLHSQKFESALEKFIDIIRNDRYYDDDGSRNACIAIFKFLGEEHKTTLKYRREFSGALY